METCMHDVTYRLDVTSILRHKLALSMDEAGFHSFQLCTSTFRLYISWIKPAADVHSCCMKLVGSGPGATHPRNRGIPCALPVNLQRPE